MAIRTNFKAMNQTDFISYLDKNSIVYDKFNTTTVLGLSVVKVRPKKSRITPRIFNKKTGMQLDSHIDLTEIDTNIKGITKKQLVKMLDNCIQNMGTKRVYHPKRLKPKWNSLSKDEDKLNLFEEYITQKDSSIGFLKLVQVNLCDKTLEAIIINYPSSLKYLKSKDAKSICVKKFMKYENGRRYLVENNILLNDQ